LKDAAARGQLRSPGAFGPFDITECAQAIHRRFEQQAARRPGAPAIRMPSGDVTYAQLNAAANRAARTLLALPAATGRPVALILPQGGASVVWTLAILKAGLGYAPLDYRLPAAVLRAMVDDLDPAAVLVTGRHLDLGRTVAAHRCAVVDVAADPRSDDPLSAQNLDRHVSPDDVACVFYTSGSTGSPKGVADSHRNVLHNVFRYTNTLRFASEDRLSLVQAPSFSGTVSTLFGALLNGAAVVPVDLDGDGFPRGAFDLS
jgi:non-ribosomal peptide synthetase component F